jgi:hypothetical protein
MIAGVAAMLLVFQTTLTSLPGAASKESAELRARLDAEVKSYAVSADSFADALVKVAGDFKIPVGVEWVRTPAAIRPIRLAWKDTDARGVIQGIAHTQMGYVVEIEDAVVHIYPGALGPERQNFLNVRLDRFDIHDDVAEMASRNLGELVRLRVAPPKPRRQMAGGGLGGSLLVEMGDPNISISPANPTVGEVLDAIALASPFKVWLVTFVPGHSLTPTGFRRTVWAARGEAFPDADQPVWELLKWGRAPY